jgi:ketosteroid isomerase-like protein
MASKELAGICPALTACEILRGPMSQESMETIRRGMEAFNRKDTDTLTALSTDDLRIRPATQTAVEGEDVVYSGKSAWASYFAFIDEVWEDWRIDEAKIFDADYDQLAAMIRMVGTGAGSGARVERSFGLAFWLRGGRIRRLEGYERPGAALEAVGLSEQAAPRTSPGSTGESRARASGAASGSKPGRPSTSSMRWSMPESRLWSRCRICGCADGRRVSRWRWGSTHGSSRSGTG